MIIATFRSIETFTYSHDTFVLFQFLVIQILVKLHTYEHIIDERYCPKYHFSQSEKPPIIRFGQTSKHQIVAANRFHHLQCQGN